MPNILFHDFDRYNIPNFCSLVEGNVGIELGVATGLYSRALVGSGRFKEFYGVDRYSDHHDTQEYLRALKHVGLRENYNLIRESFDNALTLFDDQYFDYIYIDGYAHTGQDGQKTLTDWWPKLKVNGIFAGDDYHSDFPLTMAAVDDFALQANTQLNVTAAAAKSKWDQYPSWYFKKLNNSVVSQNKSLRQIPLYSAKNSQVNLSLSSQQTEDLIGLLSLIASKNPDLLQHILARLNDTT